MASYDHKTYEQISELNNKLNLACDGYPIYVVIYAIGLMLTKIIKTSPAFEVDEAPEMMNGMIRDVIEENIHIPLSGTH